MNDYQQPQQNQNGAYGYQQQPQVVVVNQQNTAVAGNTKTPVKKVPYILLAILLGTLGAQFFYSGKTGAGVASVIFCWTIIPAIIGIIQGIAAIFKEADENGYILV